MKKIVLDVETTGLEAEKGHRIIEIACVEICGRTVSDNVFRTYINPKRKISEDAVKIHGLTEEFLSDKPEFSQIAGKLIDFIQGAELLIHNAPFDIGFLKNEFSLSNLGDFSQLCGCKITDTLEMARQLHPGLKNNLDALCERYNIDNSMREKHDAMTDVNLLSEVYLAMTGGQSHLDFESRAGLENPLALKTAGRRTPVIKANPEELHRHEQFMKRLKRR